MDILGLILYSCVMAQDDNYLNSEQFLKDFIHDNGVPNKDEFMNLNSPKQYIKKEKRNHRSRHIVEIKADFELDLHEMTVDEAIANLEITFEDMKYSGLKILRIIHGGGFGQYGPVKKYVDRHLSGPLRSKISQTRKEGHNSGTTLVYLR